MADAALDLSGIVKRYPGVIALNRVDFACRPGEVHAVLGENGSGKSTLLGIASGAVTPDEGRVRIMGRELTAADPMLARRLGLATVYQDDSLVRELSVRDNLRLALGRTARAAETARVRDLLAAYAPDIQPGTVVGALTPSQRQLLEIVKALAIAPKVLLLDEPTASLDMAGVEALSSTIRRITAAGTAVVYVSHRLPEILALAQRVTILRDGEGQGTHVIDGTISEADLVELMIGRPVEAEFPPAPALPAGAVALAAAGLTGARFRDVSLSLHRGEILGFAGAEGNGQRDALRALGGIEPSTGTVLRANAPVNLAGPRAALAAGILSISADRSGESIFPVLGVRENMTVQVLGRYADAGLIAAGREYAEAAELAQDLNIVAATLDTPIGSLSGGNQQKAVLARAVLRAADVLLIDEPTQGVDANARFDIYRAIRDRAAAGTACIINSSDALELAGLCSRVLVFSRGRVIRELRGTEVTEEGIVAAFLRSGETAMVKATAGTPRRPDRWWAPLAVLLLLLLALGGYAASQSDAFLSTLNLRHILLATAPLALATMAQLSVLLVRGFDLSVGSAMSLVVVILSFLVGADATGTEMAVGVAACLAAALAVGAVNGGLVRGIGINPVIATIATLSVLQGIALVLRPDPGGEIGDDFLDIMRTRLGFAPLSFVVLLACGLVADIWLYASHAGLQARAVGFREQAARRNGVRVRLVHLRAYLLSAVLAALAGFFLASEVGVGHPTIGADYTLTSIAAAVLGGAALGGGRGSYVGALLSAVFFAATVNVITLNGFSTGAGIIASGALTLFAVLLYSGLQPLAQLWAKVAGAVARTA